MSKKRLGKGLGALIPEFKEEVPELTERGVNEIPLEQIIPNPNQPRKDFSTDKLMEMAETIKTYGVIQPVLVKKEKDKYILVAGERRYKAAQFAGLKAIPAIIKDYSSEELTEIALVENLQREDLNPIEEAEAYKRLLDEFGLIQEELAKRIGRSRSSIANALRLLTFDDEIKKYLIEGKITSGQARPLLSMENREQQGELALKIINDNLTARQIENLVKNLKRKRKAAASAGEEHGEDKRLEQLLVKEVEEKIRKAYGTRVNIKKDLKGGRIELYFFGDEDLERLVEILLKEAES